jgi:hypothetical protein
LRLAALLKIQNSKFPQKLLLHVQKATLQHYNQGSMGCK